MAQFVAFDPRVEVSGQSMLSTIEAMGEPVRPLLVRFGFTNIDPNKWYPQQPYLDFYRDVASGDFQSTFDLVSIGMKVPTLAYWPPEIRHIVDALRSVDEAFHMNHRGGEIGHYRIVAQDEHSIEMHCQNPYPCDFDYGLIYGVAQMYLPRGADLNVQHLPGECRKHGGDACTYFISW